MLVDTYIPTANILAFNEKCKSQADGCATAKHGLQFLACIMFPHKGLGKFSTQNFVTGDQ